MEFVNGDVEHAHMWSDGNASTFHISRLVVRKNLSLPPNSVVNVDASMESPADVPFAFELMDNLAQKMLLMMLTMIQGEQTVQIAILNLADVHVKLWHNQELRHVIEVNAMLDMKVEEDGKAALYAQEYDQGVMSVSQQYQVCQLQVISGEHPDVTPERTEQGDLRIVMGDETGFVGGSLRDSKFLEFTNSSMSDSRSCHR